MLVLTRKTNESIIINDNIEIKVLEASSGKVKLGIAAPKDIEIVRSEIRKAVESENKEAISKIDINKLKNVLKDPF
ncbi:carbon storage regulator, CsrA [Alkalithermobacter thermoalcaliphilus JW-YL-7 = DSM 7308]|uniref:Translational regulator CsrA n=1 Tax=Alkalithermobacter thermoalcaliphilus JW-YL-7 = DSM 7308 TaxID=1121328 RepID=A0A150FN72_CLOPD|nr:carbon storage regulator, CsrA [[Clostridium] paradoxum JW-YL-7 = DSM 7308]SHL05963.1 carbon storage regulator, CsrA [[Clostridium] paradoxum JW-YL-7 = DSM 7308]